MSNTRFDAFEDSAMRSLKSLVWTVPKTLKEIQRCFPWSNDVTRRFVRVVTSWPHTFAFDDGMFAWVDVFGTRKLTWIPFREYNRRKILRC